HLAEMEQHLHERRRVDADLLGEVGQRGTARQANGLAVALADPHAADRRRLHLVEFLALGALALATATRRAPGAAEGALGAAALVTTGSARTTAARRSSEATRTSTTGTSTTGTTATGTTATGTTGALAGDGRLLGHHRRVGTRHARASGGATLTGGRRTRRAILLHALLRRERVVARPRTAGARPGTGTGSGSAGRQATGLTGPGAAASRQASGLTRARPGGRTGSGTRGGLGRGGRRLGGGRLGGRGLGGGRLGRGRLRTRLGARRGRGLGLRGRLGLGLGGLGGLLGRLLRGSLLGRLLGAHLPQPVSVLLLQSAYHGR